MSTRPQMARLARASSCSAIPLEVSVELTERCNFTCRHCYLPDHSGPDALSTDRILGLLEELAETGTLFLTLTGGEVLLRRDWLTVAQRARALGFMVTVLTNGSLVDEAAADALAQLPAAVQVSLYAAEPEAFEAVTARQGSFAATLRGVELLLERGIDVVLKTPLMTLNRGAFGGVEALAERLGTRCESYTLIAPTRDGRTAPLALRLPPAELAGLVSPRDAGTRPSPAASPVGLDDHPCGAGSRFAHITAAGELLPCSIMPLSAGSLVERSFGDVWRRSPVLDRLRRVRRRDLSRCATCPSFASCGRCPAQALAEDGDLLGPSRAACRYAEALERLLGV